MVQLKVSPGPQAGQIFDRISPDEAGAAGQARSFGMLGQAIEQKGQMLTAVADARARSTAARFDAALGQREADIRADPNDAPNFEKKLRAAHDELQKEFSATPFINRNTFNEESSLRFEQRIVGLRGEANRLILESGRAALDESMFEEGEKFALAPISNEDERAYRLGRMQAVAMSGAANGLLFQEELPAFVRKAQVAGVISAVARLNNENPVEAMALINENSDVLDVKTAALLTRQSVERWESDLASSVSNEKAERARARAAEKALQLSNQSTLMLKASEGNGGITTKDVNKVMRSAPNALTPEAYSGLMNIALGGGFLGSPSNMNPLAAAQMLRWMSGEEQPPNGKNVKEAITELAIQHKIPTDKFFAALDSGVTKKFVPIRTAMSKVVESLALVKGSGLVNAMDAGLKFDRWLVENGDTATVEEAFKAATHFMALNNVFDTLSITPQARPAWYVFRPDMSVDVAGSEAVLATRGRDSLTGKIPTTDPDYMTPQQVSDEAASLARLKGQYNAREQLLNSINTGAGPQR